jgi:hypothetical protein
MEDRSILTPSEGACGRPSWGLRTHDLAFLAGLALTFTLANAFKPLVMDDSLYAFYAGQIAKQPLDPYGFQMLGYQVPTPAIGILSPVFMHYWWSVAIRLFGESPFLWKLWFLPVNLLFTGSLLVLFRRFARGWEWPLTALTVLSPVFLPSPNLMLDVPCLAFGLFSITTFLTACDRGRLSLAIASGLAAGLAIGTKYTALLTPAVLMAYALVSRRIGLGILASVVAAGLFVGWEAWIASVYGQSHFLIQIGYKKLHWLDKLNLATGLVSNLGGVASATALLGLVALRVPARWVRGLGLAIALGYGLLAVAKVDLPVFLVWGALTIGTGIAVTIRVFCPRPGEAGPSGRLDRDDVFLVLWLALEVAGVMALSPFSASRRLMGLLIVGNLLAGRLASRTCLEAPRARLVRCVVAFGIVLGWAFYGIDLRDAFATRQAAEGAARLARAEGPEGTVWYIGRWGFRYYAERAGMKPVVPDESRLKPGDWLVIADPRIIQPALLIDPGSTWPFGEVEVRDALPYRTQPYYYYGRTPLKHASGPRQAVKVLRVTADWTPRSNPDGVAQAFLSNPRKRR